MASRLIPKRQYSSILILNRFIHQTKLVNTHNRIIYSYIRLYDGGTTNMRAFTSNGSQFVGIVVAYTKCSQVKYSPETSENISRKKPLDKHEWSKSLTVHGTNLLVVCMCVVATQSQSFWDHVVDHQKPVHSHALLLHTNLKDDDGLCF